MTGRASDRPKLAGIVRQCERSPSANPLQKRFFAGSRRSSNHPDRRRSSAIDSISTPLRERLITPRIMPKVWVTGGTHDDATEQWRIAHTLRQHPRPPDIWPISAIGWVRQPAGACGAENEPTAAINCEDGRMLRFVRRCHRRLYSAGSHDQIMCFSGPLVIPVVRRFGSTVLKGSAGFRP